MRKWFQNVKVKLHIPSGRAILHFVILEAILAGCWQVVSMMFDNTLVREIGFLVIFCVGILAVAWYLPKLSPRWTGAVMGLPMVLKNNEEPIDIDWLKNLAQQDIDNLLQRIKVEVRKLEFAGLKNREPYFELVVNVINTTVFKVRLKGCVGYIQTSSGRLSPPQVQEPLPSLLLHSESKKFTLSQTVTPQTAQWLIEQADTKNPVNFVCIQCRLVFDVVNADYNGEVEIVIKDDGLPCSPEGTYIVPFSR